MKVKELKAVLERADDDAEVIVTRHLTSKLHKSRWQRAK